MTELSSPNLPISRWKTFAIVSSGVLGLILVFGLFTDFSWNNAWANIIFPPSVGIWGLVSFRASKPTTQSKKQKWFRRICCIPAMIFGLPYIAIIILAILPPFNLATGFGLSEELNRSIVQETLSPNGSTIAMVSYKPSGAYTSGLGSVEIQLTYPYFSIVKRDLYTMGKTDSDTSRTDWIQWHHPNTIYIFDEKKTIEIGLVNFQIPQAFLIVYLGIAMLIRLAEYIFTGS